MIGWSGPFLSHPFITAGTGEEEIEDCFGMRWVSSRECIGFIGGCVGCGVSPRVDEVSVDISQGCLGLELSATKNTNLFR